LRSSACGIDAGICCLDESHKLESSKSISLQTHQASRCTTGSTRRENRSTQRLYKSNAWIWQASWRGIENREPNNSISFRGRAKRSQDANPPTGKTGFLSASQIPAGGEFYYNSVSGDFNGDGKTDLASEVYAYDSNSTSDIYEISVVLSNRDGTFKAPVLTPITNDECVALLVGDVNGDGTIQAASAPVTLSGEAGNYVISPI